MSARSRAAALPALRAAAPVTLPILAGFVLTGITCGVFAVSLGLPWWMPTAMSVLIFAGSAEFVVGSMLAGAFNPLQAFVTIFIVNARHLFYGLSMLERFRGLGRKRGYLIYAMCDETFSINFAAEPPAGVDRGWFMFWVSLLNQAYWVVGCTLGGTLGSFIPTTVKGLDFAMTALFAVIFMDQWLKDASHAGAIAGGVLSLGALAAFGAQGFMVPALALILAAALAMRSRVEPVYEAAGMIGDDGASDAVGAEGEGAAAVAGASEGGDAA